MDPTQTLMVALVCVNLAYLAVTRLRSLTRITAVQGVLLAAAPLAVLGPSPHGHAVILALGVLAIKGIGFPWLLARTLARLEVNPVVEPYLGFNVSLLAGVAGLLFSLWLETRLPFPPELFPPLLFPAALTSIFSGLALVVARRKALTQVIGYLAAENGIFLLGVPLSAQGSVWLELSVLLDVFVAVFVMGIALHHINKTFESIDVGRFCSLRD
ncbi:Hydrogenase-4 component E [Desulfovibrio sp. TomC]|nr:hydrogenase-4 component E [Desulfovibrio sp. TomC]KHK01255.1 Hydrogenase-4 component E [Desulfovibrio sp. TomC]